MLDGCRGYGFVLQEARVDEFRIFADDGGLAEGSSPLFVGFASKNGIRDFLILGFLQFAGGNRLCFDASQNRIKSLLTIVRGFALIHNGNHPKEVRVFSEVSKASSLDC